MSDRHQHQTEERTQAEARVCEARKAFEDQWTLLTEAKDDFTQHSTHKGACGDFAKAWGKMFSASWDYANAQDELDALNRSIP